MKKRFLTMAMTAVLGLGLVGHGSSSAGVKAESDEGSSQTTTEGSGKAVDSKGESPIKVVVAYSSNLGDKSYSDSYSTGAQQAAKDFGVEVRNLEGTTADEWETNLPVCYGGGCDLVICSNSNFQGYLEKYRGSYPDIKFAIIDTTVKGPNVASISFAQNQDPFLADTVTAMLTTYSEVEGVNDDAIIGWVGGQDIPVPHDSYVGFEQGAKYTNPDITILQLYTGTWVDPLRGREPALAQYEQGANTVMNAASGIDTDILEATREVGKYAIGVDLNQDNDQLGHVVTSMVKRVDTTYYSVIEPVAEDNFKGDITSYLEISNDDVDLADFAVIEEHLGDKSLADIQDKVQELKDKIISSEIMVDNYEGFGKDAQ